MIDPRRYDGPWVERAPTRDEAFVLTSIDPSRRVRRFSPPRDAFFIEDYRPGPSPQFSPAVIYGLVASGLLEVTNAPSGWPRGAPTRPLGVGLTRAGREAKARLLERLPVTARFPTTDISLDDA